MHLRSPYRLPSSCLPAGPPPRSGFLLLVLVWSALFLAHTAGRAAAEELRFDIKGFIVEGNTLLPEKPIGGDYDDAPMQETSLQEILEPFTGSDRTVEDIEAARSKLEQTYHQRGYPTVFVNIPEQTVEGGFVTLEVVESTIRRVRISGNRYFTMENILKEMPSLRPGEIIYLPHLQEELMIVNRNPDLAVEPVLSPGKRFGTVDVELKVKDSLPLHGSLELNNRASQDTTSLRLNGVLRYDNLWQRDHSVSLQYQTSPEDSDEVQVIAGSYVLPTPWNIDHRLAFFSVWSDSNTAFGEGFQVVGKGFIFGARYVVPLQPFQLYSHNVSVGFDYKDFDETASFISEDLKTPITYMPLSFSYNGSLPDDSGLTSFSASLNMAFRGLVNDRTEFAVKRYRAKTNYLYLTAGLERVQKLPYRSSLFVKVDGQIADQPLISNEQYTAGGMESVRGYKESSEAGDHAVHFTTELSGPDLAEYLPVPGVDKVDIYPFVFYDVAALMIKDPLTGQDPNVTIQGAGAGLRGNITQYVEYEMDWAMALESRPSVEYGDERIDFRVKCKF